MLRALPLAGLTAVAHRHYQSLLDDDERERAARFRSAADTRAYVCAHGLLRLTLSEFCPAVAPADWRFVADPRGKPRIAPLPAASYGIHTSRSSSSFSVIPAKAGIHLFNNLADEVDPRLRGGDEEKLMDINDLRIAETTSPTPPGFSLTHARGLVACAVGADHDVGVDAEFLDRKVSPLPLARRFFTAAEAQALEALPDDDARRRGFIRLWTLKEAVVKATGSGLAQSLQGFSFSPTDPPAMRIHDPALGTAADWRLQTWEAGGCALALALRGALAHEVYTDFQLVEPPS